MTDVFEPQKSITMTESAIRHAIKSLKKTPDAVGMRLRLKKTGCSGYSYVTEEALSIEENDLVFEQADNLKVIVSNVDFPLVAGTHIDFAKEGLNAIFQFSNPNSKGECGCGESFST